MATNETKERVMFASAMFDINDNVVNPTLTQINKLIEIQAGACKEDVCYVCGRATDHRGEHSDAQLLQYAGLRAF